MPRDPNAYLKKCGRLNLESLLGLIQERKELPSSEYKFLDALEWQMMNWNLQKALRKNFIFRLIDHQEVITTNSNCRETRL